MKLGYILKLLVLLFLAGFVYQQRDEMMLRIRGRMHEHFPCTIPISYTLGNFDTRFGLSREEFLAHIQSSEKVWENAAGKELFHSKEQDGDITINLVYDERQATTEKLEQIGSTITTKQDTYESLKAEYDSLSVQIRQERAVYDAKLGEFLHLQGIYEKEVSRWNKRGGAPESEYERLEQQRREINTRITALNTSLNKLNTTVATVNSLGTKINALIEELHLNVKKYNTTMGAIGEEFREGEYVSDERGRRITIYEFSNTSRLERVLIHELGHTIQLNHVTDVEAIMYRLNKGENTLLTVADIMELARVCHIKNTQL